MYKNNIFFILAIVVTLAIAFTSCQPEDEVEVPLSRLFRPGSFSRVVDGVNVSLTWVPIKNASYRIEYGRLASGLPFDSVKDMQIVELERGVSSYELMELWGSTRYGIRIKAVSLVSETADSEWASSSFTTGAENIFYPITFHPDGSDFKIFLTWQNGKDVTHIIVNNLQSGDKIFEISPDEKETGSKTLASSPDYRFRNGQFYTISIWLGERKRGENSITLQR